MFLDKIDVEGFQKVSAKNKVASNRNNQGSHLHWKTWKNERSFSSQGILEFHQKVQEKSGNFLSVREKSGKIRSENNNIILWGKSKNSCFQT